MIGLSLVAFLIGAFMGFDLRGVRDGTAHKSIPLISTSAPSLNPPEAHSAHLPDVPHPLGTCPCDGLKQCKCDFETGDYSFSDGCNSSSCNKWGVCTTTARFCGHDWRDSR